MLFIIDFDGTVAPTDTVDALLEQFADPEWRNIEEQWVSGQNHPPPREITHARGSLM